VRRRTLTGIDVIDAAHRITVHGVDAKKPPMGDSFAVTERSAEVREETNSRNGN